MKTKTLRPELVVHFPEALEEGILYISDEFSIVGHKCCCGCGEEVITPINSAQWKVEKNGGKYSLYPSIGNWKFSCQSHYWIFNNQVYDAGFMKKREIEFVKRRDRQDKNRHIHKLNKQLEESAHKKGSVWDSITQWLKKWLD